MGYTEDCGQNERKSKNVRSDTRHRSLRLIYKPRSSRQHNFSKVRIQYCGSLPFNYNLSFLEYL